MMKKTFLKLLLFILFCATSCNEKNRYSIFKSKSKNQVIVLQPLNHFENQLLNEVKDSLQKTFPNVKVLANLQLPSTHFYQARNRFRADSIIHYLNARASSNETIVGLIHTDISTTKGNYVDWGVMGLGYCPGNACVISTFRLNEQSLHSQFYKVGIHEIGHTIGLPHCDVKTCYMRDAEGKNPTAEETGFCNKCNSMFNSR